MPGWAALKATLMVSSKFHTFFLLVCTSDSDCIEANQVCTMTTGECVCAEGYELKEGICVCAKDYELKEGKCVKSKRK